MLEPHRVNLVVGGTQLASCNTSDAGEFNDQIVAISSHDKKKPQGVGVAEKWINEK